MLRLKQNVLHKEQDNVPSTDPMMKICIHDVKYGILAKVEIFKKQNTWRE